MRRIIGDGKSIAVGGAVPSQPVFGAIDDGVQISVVSVVQRTKVIMLRICGARHAGPYAPRCERSGIGHLSIGIYTQVVVIINKQAF